MLCAIGSDQVHGHDMIGNGRNIEVSAMGTGRDDTGQCLAACPTHRLEHPAPAPWVDVALVEHLIKLLDGHAGLYMREPPRAPAHAIGQSVDQDTRFACVLPPDAIALREGERAIELVEGSVALISIALLWII